VTLIEALATDCQWATAEEGGLPDKEFKDIYGIMTIHGIPKPAWRAFQLLHTHAGSQRLSIDVAQGTTMTVQEPAGSACSLVPDTDFKGADILPESQRLDLPDANACCNACQANRTCQAWSYGGPNSTCCKSRCYLKHATGWHRVKDPTMTSGYRGGGPPLPVKPYVAAMATMNSTSDVSSLRVFLSHWTDDGGLDENRTVQVFVNHDSMVKPTIALLYSIDDMHTNPKAVWEAMGSPAVPDAAQMTTLTAASQVFGPAPAALTTINATTSLVTVHLLSNSAVVVAFQA